MNTRRRRTIVLVGVVTGITVISTVIGLGLTIQPRPVGHGDRRAPVVKALVSDAYTVIPTEAGVIHGEILQVPSAWTATPTVAFSSDEAGAIVYLGDCSAPQGQASVGRNTITLSRLDEGRHSNCALQVRDAAGNTSSALVIPPFSVGRPPVSIARTWNEVLLSAIRVDRARPPVQARNLFHTSAAMYDLWATYDGTAGTYLYGRPECPAWEALPLDRGPALREAISYAMYRLIAHRFGGSPGIDGTTELLNGLMAGLGYDPAVVDSTPNFGAAQLGNYVAACYIAYGLEDGSNEAGLHSNIYYQPINPPLIPTQPGTQEVVDLDRWQPLALDVFIDQAGNVISGGAPPFIGAEWGNVTPFAISPAEMQVMTRDANGDGVVDAFNLYHDPGPPPSHLGPTAEAFWWNFSLVAEWSGQLDPSDHVLIDISPGAMGNDPGAGASMPTTLAEYQAFYDEQGGGDSSPGHALNPATGLPYAPQIVPRGDYARVLAEFWADGPDSETPPGHWFTILNYVTDQLEPDDKQWAGAGPMLDGLEWDVKSYFALGGAMHDAAISAWSVKGWYDGVRPITAIRAMDAGTIVEIPGSIEIVRAGDPLADLDPTAVGKVKIRAWRGPYAVDPASNTAGGVDWILAENWWPYQRPTFVTPPFAGYVSGHSTYSRAGADILTAITGDPYFPGGLAEFVAPHDAFLVFETGPSTNVVLQWATYRDAADQSALSRIWGGIHPPFDDVPGRRIGSLIAADALTLAARIFAGLAGT